MKTLTLTTVVIGALLAADGASAHERHYDDDRSHHSEHRESQNKNKHKHKHKNKYEKKYDMKYQDRYDYSDNRRHFRKHNKHIKHAKSDVIRLDIPVHIRGDRRVRLGRLLRDRYDVNPTHYRLRKVVVDNHGRRHATARLRVGGQVVEHVALDRGRNHLKVPRRADGKWVLGLNNARVDNIRLVLEPRRQYVQHHGPSYRDGHGGKYRDSYDRRYDLSYNDPRRWFKGTIRF